MRFHFKRTVSWILICCIAYLLINSAFFEHQSLLPNFILVPTARRESYNKNVTTKAWSLQRFLATRQNSELLWPSKEHYDDDRIVNQLKFRPGYVNKSELSRSNIPLKKIYLSSGFGSRRLRAGRHVFLEDKCLVNTCEIIRDVKSVGSADAVFFHSTPRGTITRTSPNQIWLLYILESPYHTGGLGAHGNKFNWTATYRHDSDIVAPYEKFVRYNESVKFLPQNKSYAEGKTKKVAWFVSNCGAKNNRLNYARELSKYISVDIYGACGRLHCPRRDKKCFDMLNTDYKFYLSFENSNCRDYITEKFFVTGLQYDVLPIVMGAAPEDYVRAAPPHSFIHVDDFQSPEQLAQYLHKLDQSDDLYNEYFQWKGTGTFINTYFWCRICGMLHETSRESHAYRDLEKWWRGDGVCIGKDNWRQRQRTSKFIVEDYLL